MADRTGIEWTDATWNPLRGCSRVSEGCRHCYAETVAARFSGPGMPYEGLARRVGGEARWTGEVRLVESALDQPLRWKRPRRIFINSMSDLFHEKVPDEWIDRIFAVMALAPQHTFQILTKRPERMLAYCSTIQKHGRWLTMEEIALQMNRDPRGADNNGFDWLANKQFLPNVWLGVSVEDQATADARIPLLLKTPAAKRFISAEPLLGALNITPWLNIAVDSVDFPGCPAWTRGLLPSLDWVICGGESGQHARPMHPDWARTLRDQCADADVPFFFKQWGEWCQPWAGLEYDTSKGRTVMPPAFIVAQEGTVHCFKNEWTDGGAVMVRVGKRAAGALLDGREHKAFPEVFNA